MKKLFAVVGLVVMLSLIWAMPAMAAGNKPAESAPHFDVNFVTGLTDPSYQIKVFEVDNSPIDIVFGPSFAILDSDATDGTPGKIQIQEGVTYDVSAQLRGKPGTGFMFLGTRLKSQPVWVPLGQINTEVVGGWVENLGSHNVATRWFPLAP